MEAIYKIPEANLGFLEAEIEKLTKKALKLVVGAIGMEILSHEDIEIQDPDGGFPSMRRVYAAKIFGDTPRLSGWSFIATLSHTEGGVLLRTVPGEALSAEYRDADPLNCDHCHTRRSRTETFIVRHDSGKYAQVGRNCLADFIGNKNPHAIAQMAELLIHAAELAEGCENEGFGRGEKERWLLSHYLTLAAGAIRTWGWVSRTKAKESQGSDAPLVATVERIDTKLRAMRGRSRTDWAYDIRDNYELTQADEDLAAAALLFAQENLSADTDSDYLYNLAVVSQMGSITEKEFGLAASLIPWYQRETEQRRKQAERAKLDAVSEWVGKVKERITVNVTVEHVQEVGGAWGVTHLHKMRDGAGNILVWFSSSGALEQGEQVRIVGTVKAHETYRDAKQTVLTRCAVVYPCAVCGADGNRYETKPTSEEVGTFRANGESVALIFRLLCPKHAKPILAKLKAQDDLDFLSWKLPQSEQQLESHRDILAKAKAAEVKTTNNLWLIDYSEREITRLEAEVLAFKVQEAKARKVLGL